jgi:mRNA interferase RelE/StbE
MPSSNDAKGKKPEYTVLILPSVQKQLNKLPGAIATRIEDKLLELEQDPRPPGCKKLKGRDAWRIRIGDYRAIYEIHDGRLIVTVITIGHRREVYE